MNELDFREILHEILALDMDEEESSISKANTFGEAGLLTTNEGLVIKTKDGSEFQLTIVQSK